MLKTWRESLLKKHIFDFWIRLHRKTELIIDSQFIHFWGIGRVCLWVGNWYAPIFRQASKGRNEEGAWHSVWKSQKKSHFTLRAKRAMFTLWVNKCKLKNAKNSQFWEVLKIWSYLWNRVIRLVYINRAKIGGKCQNWKIKMRRFW